MTNRIRNWIEDRTRIKRLLKVHFASYRGGAGWSYVFGSGLVFLFILQALTGIILANFYSPSSTSAWGSVYYLQEKTSFGWFVRGLHHYGSSAIIILAVIHMFQAFIFGAYKKPRELNWISGIMLLLILMGFGLTGYLLPWDQKGYWATQVATNAIETIPLIGSYVKILIQGGSDYGNLTLTRFYALHVFKLPLSLLFFFIIHIALFRIHGVTPNWKQKKEALKRVDPYWPDQAFKDIVFAMGIYAVLAGWVFWDNGAKLFAPADPTSNFIARPEWYFLFLFQLLKYCQGKFLIVGTFIIPTLIILFLFALPFIDTGASRYPSVRIPFLGAIFSLFAGIIALTAISVIQDNRNPYIVAQRRDAEIQSARAMKLAAGGIPPAGGTAIFLNDPVYRGEKIFRENCMGCHKIRGKGGDTGPDFTGFGSRKWIAGLLKNPNDAKYFGESGTMPPTKLPDDAILDIAEFLLHRSEGLPGTDIARLERGKRLVLKGTCVVCHPIGNKDHKKIAPNLTNYLSATWLKEFIRNPSDPRFYGTRSRMPGFDKFSDTEMEALIQYLFTLSDDQILISKNTVSKDVLSDSIYAYKKKQINLFGMTSPRGYTRNKTWEEIHFILSN
ncbi:MAG: cytochrome b N-terminal domain-containing protein [Candidatus Loosdrechtia sp.]|uniref:cytochrome b N-terminal domain-containing protein n=1 Tax=Candidatus Loosdrechtia sp. TaxID=3101272 RepID=UPI003A6A0F5E|nr:MAG: cytochrome b N-terminal domain-containing protein [Candidatus Jettenia sp. AMX2]